MKNQTLTKMNDENNLNSNGDIKQTTHTMRARDLLEHKDKYQYLEYEVRLNIDSLRKSCLWVFFSASTL